MHLIKNWRQAWRMYSMQALTIIATLQGMLAALPASTLESVIFGTPYTWLQAMVALSIAAAVLGALGRVIDQPSTQP